MAKTRTDGLGEAAPLGNTYLEVIAYQSGSGNLAYTHSGQDSIRGLKVINDGGGADITVTVNGMAMVVKQSQTLDERFAPFTTFSITAAVAWRCWVKQ